MLIIQNEKYYGAALLQKTFCVDYRTKEMRKNQGELPMYYVENGHEGIVTKEIFDAVQEKLSVPEENIGVIYRRNINHDLSGKLFCDDCGSYYALYQFTLLHTMTLFGSAAIATGKDFRARHHICTRRCYTPYSTKSSYRCYEKTPVSCGIVFLF